MTELNEETIEVAAWIINRPAMSLRPEHYGAETLPALAAAQQAIAREKARAVLALVLPVIERARVEERERCLKIVNAQTPDWVKERSGPYWDGYREAMEDAANDIRKT